MTDRIAASNVNLNDALKTDPVPRMAELHEVARMVAFPLSDAASYMTGQCVVIDGGHMAV